jgi:hypothetical protein
MNAPRSLSEPGLFRERLIWTAAVSVLLTTIAWLGMLSIALWARAFDGWLARAAVVGRVLLEAIVTFGPQLLGIIAAGVAASMLVGLLLPRAVGSRAAREGVRHG